MTQIEKFTLEKAYAYFEGLWRVCEHRECARRKTCTGGPRGTCRRGKGIPLCKQADSRSIEKLQTKQRRKALGEEPPK